MRYLILYGLLANYIDGHLDILNAYSLILVRRSDNNSVLIPEPMNGPE